MILKKYFGGHVLICNIYDMVFQSPIPGDPMLNIHPNT